jgi:hypothetical protein
MPGCVGVLGSEGWSKSIDVRHSYGDGLNVELATDTEVSLLTEQILLVVKFLLLEWDGSIVVNICIVWPFVLLFLFLLWLLTCCLISSFLLLCGFPLFLFDFLDFFWALWSSVLVNELCFGNWLVVGWEDGSYLEHLTSPFTIRCCNNRSMNVEESSMLEELMGCKSKSVSDSDHCSEGVGSASQMCLISQGLKNNKSLIKKSIFTYFKLWSTLNWVGSIALSKDSSGMDILLVDLQLEVLALSWRLDERSLEDERCADDSLVAVLEALANSAVDDDL